MSVLVPSVLSIPPTLVLCALANPSTSRPAVPPSDRFAEMQGRAVCDPDGLVWVNPFECVSARSMFRFPIALRGDAMVVAGSTVVPTVLCVVGVAAVRIKESLFDAIFAEF